MLLWEQLYFQRKERRIPEQEKAATAVYFNLFLCWRASWNGEVTPPQNGIERQIDRERWSWMSSTERRITRAWVLKRLGGIILLLIRIIRRGVKIVREVSKSSKDDCTCSFQPSMQISSCLSKQWWVSVCEVNDSSDDPDNNILVFWCCIEMLDLAVYQTPTLLFNYCRKNAPWILISQTLVLIWNKTDSYLS